MEAAAHLEAAVELRGRHDRELGVARVVARAERRHLRHARDDRCLLLLGPPVGVVWCGVVFVVRRETLLRRGGDDDARERTTNNDLTSSSP